MRKLIILILFGASFISDAFSQDTLFFYNGKKQIVKVQAISSEIIYYYNTNDTVNLHEFSKRNVSMIIYSDGMKEKFFKEKIIKFNHDTITNKYNLGKYYSKKFYRKGPPFVISMLANSVGSVGLAYVLEPVTDNEYILLIGPAISISMLFIKPPSHIAIPDMSLYNDPEFSRGFRKQTSRDKNRSVLLGFLAGLGIDFAFVFLVSQ